MKTSFVKFFENGEVLRGSDPKTRYEKTISLILTICQGIFTLNNKVDRSSLVEKMVLGNLRVGLSLRTTLLLGGRMVNYTRQKSLDAAQMKELGLLHEKLRKWHELFSRISLSLEFA